MTHAARGCRSAALLCPLLVLVLAASPAACAAQEELPLNVRRVSDRVLVTWHCDHFQGTNMAVIATAEGLVIIDTGLSPTLVRKQRSRVESELGRSDFRYLINTHMHNDHAFANEVFPEATVVGPARGVAALKLEMERIPELLERLRRGRASFEEWAAEVPADSAGGQQAREGVAAFGVGIADLERGITPRYPTSTFHGRHTLDLGDVHVELYKFAGLHSDSDILIVVPEERMLFTGDVFWGGQLPVLRVGTRGDLHQLLDHWAMILERYPDLEIVVPGHSDVPLTVDGFRGMHAYVSRLWTDVKAARSSGRTILQFLAGHDFAERYPEVASFGHMRGEYNLHQHNIYMLWQLADDEAG
jgi:glyoxylase-like metal-dependent hydrolase (beta-lactamase superfamily II)